MGQRGWETRSALSTHWWQSWNGFLVASFPLDRSVLLTFWSSVVFALLKIIEALKSLMKVIAIDLYQINY